MSFVKKLANKLKSPSDQPTDPSAEGPPPIPPRPRPPPPPPSQHTALLSDGTKQAAGQLQTYGCSTKSCSMKWQATGVLQEGCWLQDQQCCFERQGWTITHGGPGEHVDQKGRQRTELLSWPPAPAGESWVYKWRYHLSPSCLSGSKFFHLTQVLSREQGGFVVALGLVNGKIKISSIFPPPPGEELPSIPVEQYWGRTTFHRCAVVWGPGGSIDYQIKDAVTNEPLLAYKISGVNVPAQGSIKTGLYRAVAFGPAAAVVGDFDLFKN
ncbi:hypothetical protein BCR35DRAFT_301544 [Leucosporidium creatinivorum]|uniref:Concanavalin A-like lectin/glucanase domain-containing protein n=1 Tax=Leucosporidium creatinivorum TaxID=106004 RepID=A0A1Y2FWQ1_9BASI|nr:hypothetical protein BCR35DRAFT_301544 [Leucosporidium creatinivorum]